ncbi:GTPase-activating protein [Saccharomycopsis crataegensis]|uniref:GTPase-activating protein n=1 Tax=Saccharomycopsis crataegensis TaxID=43959 RepID=A0AAV5QGN5_9ASCO|nr:GTPase-activating protein [Saccharomycopsis crataegensis]
MSFLSALRSKVSELGLFDQANAEKKPSRDELFRDEFHLPESQTIQIDSAAEVSLHYNETAKNSQDFSSPTTSPLVNGESHVNHNDVFWSGRLFLTEQYLIFKDGFNGRDFNFTIHLSTIRKVERLPSKSYVFGLIITTFSGLRLTIQFIGIRSNSERFSLLLKKSLDTNLGCVKQLKPFLKTLYSEYLMFKNSPAGQDSDLQIPAGGLGLMFKFPGNTKKLRDKSKMRLWFEFMKVNGRNLNIVKQEMFYKLIRVGLPNRLRGEIWELCSGSIYSRYENIGIYQQILDDNADKTSIAIEEIEKDLNRSLPEYAAYQSDEGISRLRRVLTAYSWKNPDVGYCQAMNIVVAELLIFMSEEQAFWCLCTLCDKYTPGYYSKTMYGTLLDQRVFEALVEKTMPILWEHITHNDIQLSIISLPWFLSLFINSMPLVFSSRIIDILFLQGPRTLFQVALAIMRVNGEKLLKTTDDGSFIQVIKNYFGKLDESAHPTSKNETYRQITNFQELLVVAFKEFQDITNDTVKSYRRKHKNSVFSNIESFIKRTQIRNLPKLPNLDTNNLSNIYDRFYQVLETDNIQKGTGSSLMNFEQFEKFLSQITGWVIVSNVADSKNQEEFLHRLFVSWDSEFQGGLALSDVAIGLNKWTYNDLMSMIKTFFDLYDSTGSGYIDKEGMLQMSEGIIYLTRPLREGWVFDSITQREIDQVIAKRMNEYKKLLAENPDNEDVISPPNLTVDEQFYRHRQGERYLSAASKFLQNCFSYARPEQEIDELKTEDHLISIHDDDRKSDYGELATEEYIDEKDKKKSQSLKANKALDPDHPLAMDLPTFRMVILADESYELFFGEILASSIDINKPIKNAQSHFNIRNMFDTLVADGRKVANEVRRRIDDVQSITSPTASTFKRSRATSSASKHQASVDEEEDDDFISSDVGTTDTDLLKGAEVNVLNESKDNAKEKEASSA